MSPNAWRTVVDSTLNGTFFCAREFARRHLAAGPAAWLAEHGWQARLFRVPALGEGYGRPLPAGTDIVASNATVLITASR
jgi:NAD(P)-dependent dehydrogenase (short-subunit alcohol dehydrogenase family)